MITTSSETLRDRLSLLRQHAMASSAIDRHSSTDKLSEDHIELGYNYRMTDIQAAVGIVQLERLDAIIKERRLIAQEYILGLSEIEWIGLPLEEDGYYSNYQSFALRIQPGSPISRNELMSILCENGISTRKGVMTAHRETAYKDNCNDVSLPVSEEASDNSLMIPLYAPMMKEDVNKVINEIKRAFKG